MSRSASATGPNGARFRGGTSPVPQSSSSSSGFSRIEDTSEDEQPALVGSDAQGVLEMSSGNIVDASGLIIDSSLNTIEAMLQNLRQNRSSRSSVTEATVSHKKAKERSLCWTRKCRDEAMRSAKHATTGEGMDEIVKAHGLIDAALRSKQSATVILNSIDVPNEVHLKSVVVNGNEIHWITHDVAEQWDSTCLENTAIRNIRKTAESAISRSIG